jgi:hypothetical protein
MRQGILRNTPIRFDGLKPVITTKIIPGGYFLWARLEAMSLCGLSLDLVF